MNETYIDLPRLAADICDIVYGPDAEDTDAVYERIVAWLQRIDPQDTNIFTLALEWKRREGVTP